MNDSFVSLVISSLSHIELFVVVCCEVVSKTVFERSTSVQQLSPLITHYHSLLLHSSLNEMRSDVTDEASE